MKPCLLLWFSPLAWSLLEIIMRWAGLIGASIDTAVQSDIPQSDLPLPVGISTTHLGLSQLPHGFEPDLTLLKDSLVD